MCGERGPKTCYKLYVNGAAAEEENNKQQIKNSDQQGSQPLPDVFVFNLQRELLLYTFIFYLSVFVSPTSDYRPVLPTSGADERWAGLPGWHLCGALIDAGFGIKMRRKNHPGEGTASNHLQADWHRSSNQPCLDD